MSDYIILAVVVLCNVCLVWQALKHDMEDKR